MRIQNLKIEMITNKKYTKFSLKFKDREKLVSSPDEKRGG
jgi:hypothetical protein